MRNAANTLEPLRILACSLDAITTACGQIRLWGPLGHCDDVEIRQFKHATFLDDLGWADVVLVQRSFPCAGRARHFKAIHRSGTPLVYETDDPLHLMQESHPDWASLSSSIPHIEAAMAGSDALLLSTPALAELFPGHGRRIVVENALDERVWTRREVPRDRSPVRIVFSGTPSHADDLASRESVLASILERHGDRVHLFLMGCDSPSLRRFPQVEHVPFAADYGLYACNLRELRPHVAVIPLLDTPFNRTKSAIKWLEMSACGIAGVYEDLPPYRSSVTDGETGLLAPQGNEGWIAAVERLIVDHDLRTRIAQRAQDVVFAKHTMSIRGPQLAQALREVVESTASQPGRHRGLGFVARFLYKLDL